MRRKRRRRSSGRSSSPAARDRAKALLREGGEALERGDRVAGVERIQEALSADPSFVEPALVLARLMDEDGNDPVADALVEEAVRRGAAAVEAIPRRAGEAPKWWRDEATRPYMKALVARGWRLLARDEPRAAAEQFRKVFEMEPDEDPLGAGVFCAESWLHAGAMEPALKVYALLQEGPDVCYGRGIGLLAAGKRADATVSFWLGVLLNSLVARDVAGELAFTDIDRHDLVGDAEEADEILGRIGDRFDSAAVALLRALVGDATFRAEMARWAMLARALGDAEERGRETEVLGEIERFLDADRIGREASQLLDRLDDAPSHLPTVH